MRDLYQIMNPVPPLEPELQRRVYGEVSALLDLDMGLLFFDTTNIYFRRDEEERPEDGGKAFCNYGSAREKRDDLPLAVVMLGVTHNGIPLRCWARPGHPADVSLVPEVNDAVIGRKLGRVVAGVERSFTPAENLCTHQSAGGHYSAAENVRSEQPLIEEALSLAGRYHMARDNVEIKEIVVGEGDARRRFVLIRPPHGADRARQRRNDALIALHAPLPALACSAKDYAAALNTVIRAAVISGSQQGDERGTLQECTSSG